MVKFLLSSELWANIIGGVIAAGLITLIVYLRDRRKHKIIQELIEIMGEAIEHRNKGENKICDLPEDWVEKAKLIEIKAVNKAKQLSPTAGSLIEWLDRIPPRSEEGQVGFYVSILSAVIARIQGLMERHS